MSGIRFLVTNNGVHPPEKWAEIITDDLMEISANAPDALLREANQFRQNLLAMFTEQVAKAQACEKEHCKHEKVDELLPYDTDDHVEETFGRLLEIAGTTSFATHFEQPHVVEHVRKVINQKLSSAMRVERTVRNSLSE